MPAQRPLPGAPHSEHTRRTLHAAADDWEKLTPEQLHALARSPRRGPREPIVSYWLRTRARGG